MGFRLLAWCKNEVLYLAASSRAVNRIPVSEGSAFFAGFSRRPVSCRVSSEAGLRAWSLQSTDALWRWWLDCGSVSKVGLVEVWLSSCAVCPPKLQALFSLSWPIFTLPPFSCGSMAVAAFLECDLCLWVA